LLLVVYQTKWLQYFADYMSNYLIPDELFQWEVAQMEEDIIIILTLLSEVAIE